MAITPAMLDSLAQTLRVALTPSGVLQPGQNVMARLDPDPATLTVTDFLAGPVSGLFITKDVRFVDANVEPALDAASLNARILGGMPIVLPGLAAPPPGVSGVLGQFKGSLPFPIDVPVSLEVAWSVRDANGAALAQNTDYIAPQGLTGLIASFVLVPAVFEFTSSNPTPAPTVRRIHARVRLSAGGTTGGWVDLPDATVSVAALPIPTIAAFFRHGNYAAYYNDTPGFVLTVVPADSPLASSGQLTATLNSLQTALAPLSQVARFAAFASGIGTLSSVISAQPHSQFRARNSFDNLNDIRMISGFINDVEAEDEISSIIFVAREGKALRCYNKRGRSTKEGAFTITTGPELHVLVPYLSSSNPASQPGGRLVVDSTANTFADKLSSLEFV